MDNYAKEVGKYRIKYGNSKGKGSFGQVYLAEHILDSSIYAVKILPLETNSQIDIEREKKCQKMTSELLHPNIMRLYYFEQINKNFYLILEHCDITQKEWLNQRKKLQELEALFYFEQIIAGLEAIHGLGIIHRDLKPDNIFMKSDKILLGDFGLSVDNDTAKSIVGTPLYMDATLIKKNITNNDKIVYDQKVDIWAAGIIQYQMVTGEHPFDKGDKYINKTQFQKDQLWKQQIESGSHLTFPDNAFISDDAKDLLKKILVINSEARFTIEQIKQHNVFKKLTQVKTKKNKILEEKSEFMLKSGLMKSHLTVSQFIQNKPTSRHEAKSYQDKEQIHQIELAIDNECKRLEWLDQINEMMISYIVILEQKTSGSGKDKNIKEFKRHQKDSQYMTVLLKGKIFFYIRCMIKIVDSSSISKSSHSKNNRIKIILADLNTILLRNRHIVQSNYEIKQTDFEHLHQKCMGFFKEWYDIQVIDQDKYISDLSILKNLAITEKKYHGALDPERKKVYDCINSRNREMFEEAFQNFREEWVLSTLNQLEKFDNIEDAEQTRTLLTNLWLYDKAEKQVTQKKEPINWGRKLSEATYSDLDIQFQALNSFKNKNTGGFDFKSIKTFFIVQILVIATLYSFVMHQ